MDFPIFQLDHSISVFMVVGWYFSFLFILKDISVSKQWRTDQAQRLAASDLVFCTVCRCPTKRTLYLYGLTKLIYTKFICIPLSIGRVHIQFSGMGGIFFIHSFCFSIFNCTFCKQTVINLIRHCRYDVSDLGLHCLPLSHKIDAL